MYVSAVRREQLRADQPEHSCRAPPSGAGSALGGAQVGRGRSNTGRWSPRVAARASSAIWGLLRACLAPKVPILAPGSHHTAREVPLMGSRWPVDGLTPTDGPPPGGREGLRAPSGASQGVQRLSCPGVHRVVPFAGNAARGGRRFGGTAGEEKALTWGFSVVDPESGTIDLAPTAVWVNDR